MSSQDLPPQLLSAGEALPELIREMEKRVPYAAALLSRSDGLEVAVNDREQKVTQVPSSHGLVLTAWNGACFEEAATSNVGREHLVALARRFSEELPHDKGQVRPVP